MAVYINTNRDHDHGVQVRTHALEKAEKYAGYRAPFEDWARQQGLTDEQIVAGLAQLEELSAYWYDKYETGEA